MLSDAVVSDTGVVEVLALSLVLLLLSVEDVLSNEVNMSVATGALDGHLWLASDFIELVDNNVDNCHC